MTNKLEYLSPFQTSVYYTLVPEFLSVMSEVADRYIKKEKQNLQTKLLTTHAVTQSENFLYDGAIGGFNRFIADTSWSILQSQGYNVALYGIEILDVWAQEHNQYGGQENHIHGVGSQISGFYFLDCPKMGGAATFYDPRPAKVYANLEQQNIDTITSASNSIYLVPENGMCVFTNSWLPHSFGGNGGSDPFKFIHFNVGVVKAENNKDNCLKNIPEIVGL